MKTTLATLTGLAVLIAAIGALGAALRHLFDAAPIYAPAIVGDLAVGTLAAGCSIAAVKGFLFWIGLFASTNTDAS